MCARAGLDGPTVVRAAAALLDARGGRELTLGELAAHLGIRTPSLYNHITGQEELRRRLALLGVEELGYRLGHAAIGRSGDEAVVALAGAYRAFAHEHPGLYAASLRAPEPDDAALSAASDEILEIVRAVLAPAGLPNGELIHAIRAFRSVVHGFVSLELAGGFGLPVDVDESFNRLIRMFLRGLRTTP